MVNPVQPATVSAYLNAYFSQDWLYQEMFFDDDSLKSLYHEYYGNESVQRQPYHVEWDGAFNVKGWIAEGSGVLNEQNGFRRDEVVFTHDFGKNQASRIRLGDLSGSGNLPLLGLEWDQQPHRNHQQQASIKNVNTSDAWMQFQLLRPAQADIRVNRRSIRRLRLEAGPHALGGFQGVQGQNEVEVWVTYDNGKTESIPFIFHQQVPSLLTSEERKFTLEEWVTPY